jgi:hypothetical protein
LVNEIPFGDYGSGGACQRANNASRLTAQSLSGKTDGVKRIFLKDMSGLIQRERQQIGDMKALFAKGDGKGPIGRVSSLRSENPCT